jgi:cell wall-associated NlpC family hydrolase
MKKFIATAALLTTLAGCSASAAHAATQERVSLKQVTHVTSILDVKSLLAKVEISHQRQLIKKTITELKSHVGKTWYVFSGDTPRGWDCSGLVVWTYKHFGISLQHRASKQALAGHVTHSPRVGDIVAFYFPGYYSAAHVGIYIGNGKMVNAPRPGTVTREESIADGEFKDYKVRFIRVTGIL